jgi:mono/diheme cytochrome c family protein
MRRRRRLVLALALLAVTAGASAQEAAASAPDVDAGRRLYVSSCQRCHGIDLATNGIGFDLRTFPRDDKERFVRSVTNGLRAMPAWSATLQAGQIDLIWAYIGAVNGWKTPSAPH